MGNLVRLSQLPIGRCGWIKLIRSPDTTRIRLFDLGLVPGTKICAVRRSPVGDPVAYRVRGTIIALRKEDSGQIFVQLENGKTRGK